MFSVPLLFEWVHILFFHLYAEEVDLNTPIRNIYYECICSLGLGATFWQ